MLPVLPTPTNGAGPSGRVGLRFSPWLSPGDPQAGWPWWDAGLSQLRQVASQLLGRLPRTCCRLESHPVAAMRRVIAPLLLVALLLTGCGSAAQPPRRVVLDALALQIRLTQDQVAQALRLQPGGLPEVSRVRVEEQQPITIGDARGLRLTGRFDWRLAEDPIRVDSPFELYLQRGERGQSWRLARLLAGDQGGGQEWITEPLPLPGERGMRPVAALASGSDGAG